MVLGSATPSLETVENARRGRYRHLRLPARVDDRPMPRVELVDLRRVRPRSTGMPEQPPTLSPPLVEAWTRRSAGDGRPSSSSTGAALGGAGLRGLRSGRPLQPL